MTQTQNSDRPTPNLRPHADTHADTDADTHAHTEQVAGEQVLVGGRIRFLWAEVSVWAAAAGAAALNPKVCVW